MGEPQLGSACMPHSPKQGYSEKEEPPGTHTAQLTEANPAVFVLF